MTVNDYMKSPLNRPILAFLFVLGLVTPRTGSAAALTVTPAAVSTTYGGTITLNVTGLTNHEPVTVQTYFDLNNDGVVDAGDLLIDAFRMSESGVSTIGGITNLSVPFDSNSATDAITTALSFAPPIESVVAQKLYRVLSPSGRFAPVTASFNVTNVALNQAIAGTVYVAGTPQPGTLVVALAQPNFNFTSAALSDGAGNYFLKLPPGTYAVLPAKPGFYTDQSSVPIVTLTNGVMATNDVFMTNGSVTISGQAYDSATSNSLGGVFLQFESANLFAVAFTDTNGNYTAGVSSNFWNIRLDANRLSRRAYVAPQGSIAQADTTLGSVSNVNLALHKGNALFYGRLTDGIGTPFANVAIGSDDAGNQLNAEGITDANGYYSVVALVDTNNFPGTDVWRAFLNNQNSIIADYIASASVDVTLTNNQAYLQNFTVLPVTARISGHLQNNLGVPVSGVSVGAFTTIGTNNFSTAYVDTDANGNYSVGAASGQWSVSANCCGNHGLDSQGYYDPVMQHPVTIPPTNQVVNITVYPIGTPYLSYPSRFSSSQFAFMLTGAAGNNYTIQATTNLVSSNWFTVMIISNLPGNFYFVQDSQATNGQRFYRALLGP